MLGYGFFTAEARSKQRFFLIRRSDFSREYQLIAFIRIYFALRGELLCKSHPCDLPFRSASQHKFIPDELVFTRIKKVTKEIRPGRSCYAYP